MNTVLWIVQGVAAFMFLMAGVMKLMRTKEQMQEQMAWVEDFSQGQIRGIGVLEILGALGLILPGLTGILPILTPLAALGLGIVQVGAFFTHLRRQEVVPMGIMNLVLIAMVAFVAFGRF